MTNPNETPEPKGRVTLINVDAKYTLNDVITYKEYGKQGEKVSRIVEVIYTKTLSGVTVCFKLENGDATEEKAVIKRWV